MTQQRMTDHIDFQPFCGPAALAVATGISRARAARVLWYVQRDRGLIVAPATMLEDMVIALDRRGWSADLFDPATGQLAESAEQCLQRARRTSPRQVISKQAAVTEVIEQARPEAQPALWEFFNNLHSDKPTLGEYLQRTPGLWMVIVDAPPVAHWIAFRDHRVLVDADRAYLDSPVLKALQLHPPQA